MKKGTEGYVLIYVVVVVVLLGLASAAVCSFALSGVRAQSAALERDRARYAAEGLVEQAVARLLDGNVGPLKDLSGSDFSSEDAARDGMAAEYQARIDGLSDEGLWPDGLTVVLDDPKWDREDENVCVFPVTLTAAVDGQRVEAVADQKVRISVTSYRVEVPAGPDDDPAEEPEYEIKFKYIVSSAGLTYRSYQIQAAEPEGGGA